MAKGPPQLDAGLPLQSILGTSDLASKSEEPKLGHELQSKLGPGRRLGQGKVPNTGRRNQVAENDLELHDVQYYEGLYIFKFHNAKMNRI